MAMTRFDISAKIPEGTGREQVPEMLQALLAERLGLKFHRDTKEFPVYALVMGKGTLKIKESAPDPDGGGGDASKTPIDVTATGERSGATISLGPGSYFTFNDGRFEGRKLTMVSFADLLARFMDRPVVDMTELKGHYDFQFNVTPEDFRSMMIRAAIAGGVSLPPEARRLLADASDESLHAGIQGLGLKLDARKAPLEVLVVDHAEKTPSEN
jgi:uncharacterized protein (TIGR03435 family)